MKKVLVILFLLFTHFAQAQLQRNYTSYTVDNGLAQNTVWDAFQDYKGFMWFGTADGIDRFDGYKMHHYKWDSKDSSTLRGNSFIKFYEDSKNNLWVSHNMGVSVYIREMDCFKNVFFEATIKNGNGESYATILGEDQKGRMWSVSGNQEILAINMRTFQEEKRLNVTTSRYQVSSIRTSITINNNIYCYLNDSGTTWFKLNTETDKIDIINGPKSFTGFFFKYNDSTICSLNKSALYLYHVNENRFETKLIKPNAITEKLERLSSTSLAFWQGKIWLGNNTGLYVFNPKTNVFEERITSFNKAEKVGFYYVQFLRVDKSGNLWVCTNGDGAKCLSPYRNKFKHYKSSVSETKLVKSITSDAEHNIYTGMYAEGIVTYKTNNKSEQFKFGKQKDEHAHVLAQAIWNKRYFVIHDRYLKELNPLTKKELNRTDVFHYKNFGYCAYPFFHQYKNKLYLSCDLAFYEIQPSGKGKLLFKFNTFDTIITCFSIINDTTWWVGTTKFVCTFNPISKKWKKLPLNVYTKTLCLSNDKKYVWVGAAVGLYLTDLSGKVLKKFEITEGLPDDFIYGILEDNKGRFWMSHNKGISVYNPINKTFKNYGVKDGLQSNEFNTGAYYKDEKGLMYFGGVNGINIIDPNHFVENKNAPQIAINEILLGDLPFKTDTAYNEIKSLTLSYLDNTLSFDFSALEFSQPENNTYKYRLSGYDNNWIQSGTRHFARYANLPPGKYVFQVMAANADGFWNNEPRNIFIT
ncbi:MAG: triple tyrosine motif-containing protein, partial [Bacteroidia bacterium]